MTLPPPGPARRPASARETGAGAGLALAWGAGPGTWGRGRRPLEGQSRRGAASGTQHCGCGEPGRAAPTAADASETRRLPGALGFGTARRLRPPRAAWSRERAIPASRARPSGNLCAGTRVGARWQALRFELRASPAAAACLKRPARSAAAVTVCQCQVCAAGGGGCNRD